MIVFAKQGYTVDLLNRSQHAFQPVTGEVAPPKMSGGYQVRLAKIKEEYPRAYQEWSKDDDHLLLSLFKQGTKVKELSQRFQRRPSAIRSRLKKLENTDRGKQPG